MLFGLNTLILLATLLGVLYFYLTRKFNYWSCRGVAGPRPIVLFGTFYQNFFKTMQDVCLDNSRKYGKVYGGYFGTKPVLMISDPKLVKDVYIKDFHIFTNRDDLKTGDHFFDGSLFNMKDDDWKNLRSIISPTFSSGKMRLMHPIMLDCVQTLVDHLEANIKGGDREIVLNKWMFNVTMDVISQSAFGSKIDVYAEKRSDFFTYAQKIIEPSFRDWIIMLMVATFPNCLKYTGQSAMDPSATKFFRTAIRSIISRRKAEKAIFKDYLQLILSAQNNSLDTSDDTNATDKNSEQIFGQTDDILKNSKNNNKSKIDITDEDILGTSFLFLLAGYVTTGSLLSYLFYRLALDEKCQQKLYEEASGLNGDYSYENVTKMPYLDACIAETLRLHNLLAFHERVSSQDYKMGDTGITISKGTYVYIDVESIHKNPDYYPNAEEWDPERFMPQNRDQLVPYTYMPFALGPRNCLGMRFALMEAKTAAAHLITKFQFVRTNQTTVPLKPQKLNVLLYCGDITVEIKLRN